MKYFYPVTFLIVVTALVAGLVLKGSPGNPSASELKNIPEYSLRDRGRFLLTQNLVERRTFALTREQADIAAPDAGYYKGDWYELYPPGLSVLAIPFYLLGLYFNMSLLFTFGMGGLFTIGSAIYIYFICKKILDLPAWASVFAGLVFVFATNALGYTTSLFQHNVTTFFILSSFYSAYLYKNNIRWGFLWGLYVWVVYGIMIFIDYPNALLMLPVIAYLLAVSIKFRKENKNYKIKVRPALVFTSMIFIAITLLHGYYNYVHFDSWTKLSGSLPGFREGVHIQVDQGNIQEVNAEGDVAKGTKVPVSFFKEEKLINGFTVLMFSSDRGLFIYSPILILGFLGMIYAVKVFSIEKLILISLVAVCIFFYSSWGNPWAGWAFGPRYLIPSLAILAIFVASFLHGFPYRLISKLIAFILVIFSSAVALLGAVTTNAVPPKIEAISLKIKYGFFYNIDRLKEGETYSFAYNHFFKNYFSLGEYYGLILGFIIVIFSLVLFVLPRYEKDGNWPGKK